MGSLTTGIGLISGIDTATLIDQLIALEGRGKVNLQLRLASLQSQQTALLDINARLLNLKTSSKGLRIDNTFDAALATSSKASVLTAAATGAAQPGSYSFLVKQLVSTSQKLSKGFTNTDTTPLNLSSLSFELGKGFVTTDTELADLRGGIGVARGKITITDGAASTTVDLSAATTIGEVINAINNSGADVTATTEGDHLVVTENTGDALTIANASGYTTATELGIAGTDVGGTITGTDIRTLGGFSPLASLNDDTGVFIRSGSYDFKITTRNGREFDIDLGRVDNPITTSTLIEDLNNGLGVTTNSDSTEDIKFVDRDGIEHLVDLTGINTVQDLMDRVNDQSDGDITISIHADGDKLTVTDNTGGSGLLKVLGAGPLDTQTADDLGILETTGVPAASFDGDIIPNADHTPAAVTIQEVIDRINNAEDTFQVINGGHVVASIAPDGVSIQLEDIVGGGPMASFTVTASPTNAYAARDLGLEGVVASGGIIDGHRLIAGLNSVLVRSLNGGNGLSGNTALDITDRQGGSDSFTLDEDGSLSDIIDQINASGSIEITAIANSAGNGLTIVDTSGGSGNLIVTDTAAAELGIDTGPGGIAASRQRGTDLELRYVAEGTSLTELNYGRGIGSGSFRITDGEGEQATVNIGSDSTTVFDIIDEINAIAGANSVDVTARVNDTGDGILLENTLSPVPTGLIKVESISGSTARDLNLEGQATTDGGSIDGSYEKQVTFNNSDTLSEVVQKVNDAGIPVSASILNTGVGAVPYKVVFSSEIGGTDGDLVIDDGDDSLGITTLSKAVDSKVFFGSDDPAEATLIKRSTNTLDDVLPGVSIDLLSADDEPVTLTITRDTQTIEDDVAEFVAAFNDAVGRIDQYDFYNVDTEERGPLLGNPTTAQVRGALFRTIQQKAVGVDTQFQYLSQVGIRVGAEGTLTFDRAKFEDAYEEDAEAVENLFTAFSGTTTTTQQLSPGVTITSNEQSFSELGFADLFDQLLDGLTNSIDGTVTLADKGIQDQIDLTEDRIDDFDDRLDRRREQLQREFAAMETALAQLQSQQNALLSLINNLSLTQGLLS